jgi:hypothetical protein
MVIAALANAGGEFGWTWVNPNEAWMNKVDTINLIEAGSHNLTAVFDYIAGIVAAQPSMITLNPLIRHPTTTPATLTIMARMWPAPLALLPITELVLREVNWQ